MTTGNSIFISDTTEPLSKALKMILSSKGYNVICMPPERDAVLEAVSLLHPRVAVVSLDINPAYQHDTTIITGLRSVSSATRIAALSYVNSPVLLRSAVTAGASKCFLMPRAVKDLAMAVAAMYDIPLPIMLSDAILRFLDNICRIPVSGAPLLHLAASMEICIKEPEYFGNVTELYDILALNFNISAGSAERSLSRSAMIAAETGFIRRLSGNLSENVCDALLPLTNSEFISVCSDAFLRYIGYIDADQ